MEALNHKTPDKKTSTLSNNYCKESMRGLLNKRLDDYLKEKPPQSKLCKKYSNIALDFSLGDQ